jgi:hypothetical protein
VTADLPTSPIQTASRIGDDASIERRDMGLVTDIESIEEQIRDSRAGQGD